MAKTHECPISLFLQMGRVGLSGPVERNSLKQDGSYISASPRVKLRACSWYRT